MKPEKMSVKTRISRIWTAAGNNRVPILSFCLAVLAVVVFLYYFYAPPMAAMGPEQPIPFSHRVHAGDKAIPCQFCHPYAGRSVFPGMPPVEKCLYCHNYIIANHPEIKKEHAYFNTKTPTPWVKANYLPEYVFFNHQCHIRKQIACQACHGQVQTQDRIQGVVFQMGFCITCHKQKGASVGCWLACHN